MTTEKMKLPFFNKVYQLKRKRPRNLPNIPEILSDGMLSLKDDFYRQISRKLNTISNAVDVDILITMHYNVFALAFGYDTLEIYLDDVANNKKLHLKYVNLYERLDSREQMIIDYLNGSIKHMKEIDKALAGSDGQIDARYGSNATPANEKVTYKDLFTMDEKEVRFVGLNPQSINMKFPEVKMHNGKAYLYKQHYFEKAELAPTNLPTLTIPVTGQFREIAQMSRELFSEEIGNSQDPQELFKEACHRLIASGVDPLMVFVKSNFIKPSQSRVPLSDLHSEEKEMMAYFLKLAGIISPEMIGDNGVAKGLDSDVKLVNGFSNLKKIKTVLFFEDFDEEILSTLRVSLTNRSRANEVIQEKNPSSLITQQSAFCNIGKVGDLGNFPIAIPREKMRTDEGESSPTVDIVITRDQHDDQDLSTYSASRTVSRDVRANSSYMIYDLKRSPGLITTCIQPAIADNLLRRDFIQNQRTGEMILNSTISPNKLLKHYNRSSLRQRLSQVDMIVTTISRGSGEKSRFPSNLIKIVRKHPDIIIKKVICQPDYAGGPFEIPVKDERTTEVLHPDPVPGALYTYKIQFSQVDGTTDLYPIERKHRTLPLGPRGVSLRVTKKGNSFMRVSVEEFKNNIAETISKDLQNIFQDSDATKFYEDFFKEKISKNLQDIGKLYKLYVQIFDKKTGKITSTDDSEPGKAPLPANKDENGVCYFDVPIGASRSDLLITYNLIVTNPIELVSAGFDEIEDPKTRELFLSRTAAYFNTFSLTNGQLPAKIIDPVTKDIFYSHTSKFSQKDLFRNITCIGGKIEENQSSNRRFHDISDLEVRYNPDDGECIVEWQCTAYAPEGEVERYELDFFVLTAEINGLEFPIDGRPFIGYTTYKVRTMTFLGAAAAVKFRVYPIYNDFHVQMPEDFVRVEIKDIRKRIPE